VSAAGLAWADSSTRPSGQVCRICGEAELVTLGGMAGEWIGESHLCPHGEDCPGHFEQDMCERCAAGEFDPAARADAALAFDMWAEARAERGW
jgi:hypothetical protein